MRARLYSKREHRRHLSVNFAGTNTIRGNNNKTEKILSINVKKTSIKATVFKIDITH